MLSMSMICHEFETHRFSSALLSFCAMLSIKPSTLAWKELGYFNTCLSGLIWVTQLIILHASTTLEKVGAGDALPLINEYCHSFFRQDTEMLMGEVLG
jgi:hypothetical protein